MASDDGVEVGGRLGELQWLRGQLRAAIEGAGSDSGMASLSRQYQAVLVEIDELSPPVKKGTALDELASRRAARAPGSAAQSGTGS